MKKQVIWVLLALTFLTINIVFFANYARTGGELPGNSDELIRSFTGNSEDPNSAYENNNEQNPSFLNSNPPSGGGSGGSSGSAQNSNERNLNCELKQISYSLIDFKSNSTCLEFENGFCISKEIDCSVDVRNIDNIGGIFEIEFLLIEDGSSINDFIDSHSNQDNVNSYSSKIFETSFNIQSQGEEGNADKNLVCFPTTEIVPKKEICY